MTPKILQAVLLQLSDVRKFQINSDFSLKTAEDLQTDDVLNKKYVLRR